MYHLPRTLAVLAVAAAVTALPSVSAAHSKHNGHHHSHPVSGQKITVSCYRGPWKDVIWDRPNAVFVDSLVAVGYDFPTATAIGTRVCRDPALVDDPEALKATMRKIWRER